MLDLDKYMDQSIEVRIFGKTVHAKLPGIRIYNQIDVVEQDLDKENLPQKRLEVAKILLDNNKEGHVFELEELSELSVEAIESVVAEFAKLKMQADTDPNLKSPSRKAK